MSRSSALDAAGIAALRREVSGLVDHHGVPACQFSLALDSEVVLHETFGVASDTTRFAVFSVTKPFVSAVVWQLLDEGLLSLDLRPAELIPEFATHGKEEITLEQVLTHTSGFPYARLEGIDATTHEGWRQAFSQWKLDWAPGTRYEYHPLSAHWLLAELIRSVTASNVASECRLAYRTEFSVSAWTTSRTSLRSRRSASRTTVSAASPLTTCSQWSIPRCASWESPALVVS
jgi:CubicO group peptidase (beta-lactamase class C family)